MPFLYCVWLAVASAVVLACFCSQLSRNKLQANAIAVMDDLIGGFVMVYYSVLNVRSIVYPGEFT